MNDLPDDIGKPRSDHSDIATIVTGALLLMIIVGLLAFYLVVNQ